MKKVKLWLAATLFMVSTSADAQFLREKPSKVTAMTKGVPNGWNTLNVQYNAISFIGDLDDDIYKRFGGYTIEYTNAVKITEELPIYLEWGLGLQYGYGFIAESLERKIYGIVDRGFKPATIDTCVVNSRARMLSIPIPVNLVYDIPITNSDIHIAPYFGFQFRGIIFSQLNQDAKNKVTNQTIGKSEYVNLFDENDVGASYIRQFDENDEADKSVKKYNVADYVWKRFQIGCQLGINIRFDNKYMIGFSYEFDCSKLSTNAKLQQLIARIGFVL